MNGTSITAKDYANMGAFGRRKNKANSKPISKPRKRSSYRGQAEPEQLSKLPQTAAFGELLALLFVFENTHLAGVPFSRNTAQFSRPAHIPPRCAKIGKKNTFRNISLDSTIRFMVQMSM